MLDIVKAKRKKNTAGKASIKFRSQEMEQEGGI